MLFATNLAGTSINFIFIVAGILNAVKSVHEIYLYQKHSESDGTKNASVYILVWITSFQSSFNYQTHITNVGLLILTKTTTNIYIYSNILIFRRGVPDCGLHHVVL
jgi:hypothetical protein